MVSKTAPTQTRAGAPKQKTPGFAIARAGAVKSPYLTAKMAPPKPPKPPKAAKPAKAAKASAAKK